MKEITSLQNLINLLESNYDGIVVGVPTVPLKYSAELFILKDRDTFSGYNKEDCPYNGFSKDWNGRIKESDWNRVSNEIKYYHFENLTDFCEWYLHKDDKLKEDIDEFVEETNKFWVFNDRDKAREELHKINIEMIQDEMNEDLHLCSHTLPSGTTIMWAGEDEFHPIKKQTRRDQLRDVIKLLSLEWGVWKAEDKYEENETEELLNNMLKARRKLSKWLDEEV